MPFDARKWSSTPCGRCATLTPMCASPTCATRTSRATCGRSPQYAASLARLDAHLARLAAEVERLAAESGDDWLLIAVTSDHGHVDAGGHGGDSDIERESFVVLARPGRAPLAWPAEITPRVSLRGSWRSLIRHRQHRRRIQKSQHPNREHTGSGPGRARCSPRARPCVDTPLRGCRPLAEELCGLGHHGTRGHGHIGGDAIDGGLRQRIATRSPTGTVTT